MSLPPVRLEDTVAGSSEDWRQAGRRAEDYLKTMGFEPGDRDRMVRASLSRAAASTSDTAMTRTLVALHRQLAGRTEGSLEANADLMADSAQARLHHWLGVGGSSQASPLETDSNGHVRLASMPRMQRTNMSPARIDRRPRPWRWLLRMLGAG